MNISIQFNQFMFWNIKMFFLFIYLLLTWILKRIRNLKMKRKRIKIALFFSYFRLIGTDTNRINLDEINKNVDTIELTFHIYIYRWISIYPYENKMIDWFLHIHSFFSKAFYFYSTVIDNIVERNRFDFFLLYGFNIILLVVHFFHFILNN